MPTSCVFLIDSIFPKVLYLWAFSTVDFLLQSSRFASPKRLFLYLEIP